MLNLTTPPLGKQHLGDLIRERRKQLGHTQGHVATLSGLSVGLLLQLEKGKVHKPRIATLKAIAITLELDLNFLLQVTGHVESRAAEEVVSV